MNRLFYFVAALAFVAFASPAQPGSHIMQEGSTVYILQVDAEGVSDPDVDPDELRAMVRSTVTVIARRLGSSGSAEQLTNSDGVSQIVITVANDVSREDLESVLGIGPELEFRFHRVEFEPLEEWEDAVERSLRNARVLHGRHLTGAQPAIDQWTGEAVINMQFDQAGAKRLASLSRGHVGASISVVLDGEVISTATLNEPILNGEMRLSGGWDWESANTMAIRLRSGALPVPMEIVDVRPGD